MDRSKEMYEDFIPGAVKFGRTVKLDAEAESLGEDVGDYAEVCLPTCRDGRRQWLNRENFRRFVGWQPAVSRDKSQEMMKTISGDVYELENEPTEGFRLVRSHVDGLDFALASALLPGQGRPPYRTGCVVVQDPRGPQVVVRSGDVLDMVVREGLSVSADGLLSGRFVWGVSYQPAGNRWLPRFRLFAADGKAHRKARKEAAVAQVRAELPFVPTQDLVFGTVYRRMTSKDPGSTAYARVVYLGSHVCVPTDLSRRMLAFPYLDFSYFEDGSPYWLENIRKEMARGRILPDEEGTYLPWQSKRWVRVCRDFEAWRAAKEEMSVFAVLKDEERYLSGDQWSVTFVKRSSAVRKDQGFGWLLHVLVRSREHEREIRCRDDDQGLSVRTWRPEAGNSRRTYYSWDEQGRTKLKPEDVLAGVLDCGEGIVEAMEAAMADFPPERPADLAAYAARLADLEVRVRKNEYS